MLYVNDYSLEPYSNVYLFVCIQTYFAVMSNMLHSTVFMNKLYDLKGSPKGRTNKKIELRNNTVLKDVDLDFCFYVDPLARQRIIKYVYITLFLCNILTLVTNL